MVGIQWSKNSTNHAKRQNLPVLTRNESRIQGKTKNLRSWVTAKVMFPGTGVQRKIASTPVRRLKLCREALIGMVDPETTSYQEYAPTQEGGQL
jgi:hypothetical protein